MRPDPGAASNQDGTQPASAPEQARAPDSLGNMIQDALAALSRPSTDGMQQVLSATHALTASQALGPARQLQSMAAAPQSGLQPPLASLPGMSTPAASTATSGDDEDAGGEHRSANRSPSQADKGNKKLSSRYRGVCWNKKNKRWQSAINSSGRYLYLGSYLNEHDAARAFDKAAIKIRGRKAKLNFAYDDYTDEHGEFIDDIVLPDPPKGGIKRRSKGQQQQDPEEQLLIAQPLRSGRLVTDGDGSGVSSGANNLGVMGPPGLNLFDNPAFGAMFRAPGMLQAPRPEQVAFGARIGGLTGLGGPSWGARGGLNLSDLQMGGPASSAVSGASGLEPLQLFSGGAGAAGPMPQAASLAEVVRQLPPGCTLDNVLPGSDAVFGLIYKQDATAHTGRRGCAVWNGTALQDQGMFPSEREARQSCGAALSLLLGRPGIAPWEQQQQLQPQRRTTVEGLSNLSVADALQLAAKAAAEGFDGRGGIPQLPAGSSEAGTETVAVMPRAQGALGSGSYSSVLGPEPRPSITGDKRHSIDTAGTMEAPQAKRLRADGQEDAGAASAGPAVSAGMPAMGPAPGASTFSAIDRLSNVQLSDMLMQMAQAAAARGANAAATAGVGQPRGSDGLPVGPQQPVLPV